MSKLVISQPSRREFPAAPNASMRLSSREDIAQNDGEGNIAWGASLSIRNVAGQGESEAWPSICSLNLSNFAIEHHRRSGLCNGMAGDLAEHAVPVAIRKDDTDIIGRHR